MSLCRGSVRVSPLASVLEGAEAFAGGETKTITIDGVQYTVKNKLTTANDLSYSKDASTGELTLIGLRFEIRAQEDVAHNIVIKGNYNDFYGGSKDDILSDTTGGVDNIFYGLGGNDSITMFSSGRVYGGEGDDIISINGNSRPDIYGEGGNDTFNLNGSWAVVHGGVGDDIFNINYSYNALLAGDEGNDTFNIIGKLNNLNIDGGVGGNKVTGETNSTMTLVNVVGANSGTVSLVKGVEQTITVNGIDYTVSTQNDRAELVYKLDTSGLITFSRISGSIIVKGEVNKKHNVTLGQGLTFYGGNIGDTISGQGTIYCGSGNNTIRTSVGTIVYCGSGNNDITVASGYGYVYGGSGINNLIVNGYNNYVESGSGSMNIKLAGSKNVIYGNSGNNAIVSNSGSNNFIYGFGEQDNAEAVRLNVDEIKTVKINGVEYKIKNTLSKANTLVYSVNPVTGELSFGGTNFSIEVQKDAEHNVLLYGSNINFYGGDLDDNIIAYGYACRMYGLGGNDSIIQNGSNGCDAYGGEGDDKIIFNK